MAEPRDDRPIAIAVGIVCGLIAFFIGVDRGVGFAIPVGILSTVAGFFVALIIRSV